MRCFFVIRIENRRSYKGEGVYVGRTMRDLQGSALGNPYKVKPHGPHERGASVEMYRRWLWGHIRGGAGDVYSVIDAFEESRGARRLNARLLVRA